MTVNFAEAEKETIRCAHERLKREHAALVEVFERSAGHPSDRAVHSANLARVRQHLARLRAHRTLLQRTN